MSLYMYDEPYTFKWILTELNYGALEKDDRIKTISYAIKQDIVDTVSNSDFTDEYIGHVDIVVNKKSISVLWKLTIFDAMTPKYFMDGGGITGHDDEFVIRFNINRALGMKDQEFKKRFYEFILSNNLYKGLLHEVKHLLDSVDGIFTTNKYIKPNNSNKQIYKKYISQNREIDAMLITVISDIKRIHDEHPELPFETVTQNSTYYNQFVDNVEQKKLNKYKQKIHYFWNTLLKRESK